MGTFVENVNLCAGALTDPVFTDIQNAQENAVIATEQAAIATAMATVCTDTYDQFDDRYLGAKATAPLVDNDGNALVYGALYFDTTQNFMKVWSNAGWINAGSSVNGTTERYTYHATAGQTVFAATYEAGYIDVFINGSKLENGVDFTAVTSTSITLAVGANVDDVVDIICYAVFELSTAPTKDVVAYTVSTVDDLASVPSSYTTAIVKDIDRGGTFIWSSTGTANGGTVFAGATGFWTRQYSGAVNVKWFGAIGDGVTDDTVAIQSAIDTSRIIYFEGGYTYYLESPVSINISYTEIRGAGGSYYSDDGFVKILKGFSSVEPLFYVNQKSSLTSVRGVKISGLSFISNAINNGRAIELYNTRTVEVSNCSFYKFKSGAIYSDENNYGIDINNNSFNECGTLADATTYDIFFDATSTYKNTFITISKNIHENPLYGAVSVEADDFVITDNYYESTAGDYYSFITSRGIGVIDKNKFYDTPKTGIGIESFSYETRIVSNYFDGCTTHIKVIGPNSIITGNILKRASDYGVHFVPSDNAASNILTVSYNLFYSCGSTSLEGGILLSMETWASVGVTIDSNSFVDCFSVGINNNGCASLSIIGNTFSNLSTTNMSYGIYSSNSSIPIKVNSNYYNGLSSDMALGSVSYNERNGTLANASAASASPSTGTWDRSSVAQYGAPANGRPAQWTVNTAGTYGTLSGTTASTTSGSTTVTVNSMSGLFRGAYITISGVTGTKKITRILSSTQLILDSPASATVSLAAVSYSAPTWKSTSWQPDKGTTANRPVPTSADYGVVYLDTTLDADGKPIWWNGTAWVDATGAVV